MMGVTLVAVVERHARDEVDFARAPHEVEAASVTPQRLRVPQATVFLRDDLLHCAIDGEGELQAALLGLLRFGVLEGGPVVTSTARGIFDRLHAVEELIERLVGDDHS
jgi:hypothetical protein